MTGANIHYRPHELQEAFDALLKTDARRSKQIADLMTAKHNLDLARASVTLAETHLNAAIRALLEPSQPVARVNHE